MKLTPSTMLSSWKLVFICLGLSLLQSWSFIISPSTLTSTSLVPRRSRGHSIILQNSDDHEDAADGPTSEEETGIPQLPAIGASSFSNQQPSPSTTTPTPTPNIPMTNSSDKESSSKGTFVALVAPKFQIQYTCKVCETRNSLMVSRIAYRKGVVITVCKGCESQHLLADNLGYGGFNAGTNIEDYLKANGLEEANRVSSEVFELEQLLDLDGAMRGEDGLPVLE